MRENVQRRIIVIYSCVVLVFLIIFICQDLPSLQTADDLSAASEMSEDESRPAASSNGTESVGNTIDAESAVKVQDDLPTGGRININTATWEELTALDGIGEALAKRIVEYREQNGAYSSPEELLEVPGIGEKRLQAIRDQIVVS